MARYGWTRLSRAGWAWVPAAALTLMASGSAFAASPAVSAPSTVTVNSSFKLSVTNIPAGTANVDVVLVGMDNQDQGAFLVGSSVSSGQTSVALTTSIPNVLKFGTTTVDVVGGPRTVSVDFVGSSNNVIATVPTTIDVTGIPSDREVDDTSATIGLSYNPATKQATVTDVPTQAYVQVFFRSPGQPESVAENSALGSSMNNTTSKGPTTFQLYSVPGTPGYLEAEVFTNSGTLDSAEIGINGLPTGQMPEAPWAAALPPVLLAGLAVAWTLRGRRLARR